MDMKKISKKDWIVYLTKRNNKIIIVFKTI